MNRTAIVERSGDKPLVKNNDVQSSKASTSRRFWGVKERAYAVKNPKALVFEPGDTVELFLPPGRTVMSAALTFLLPLALFPVGYTLGLSLFGSGEGPAFLAGFGLLLAGFPLGALLRRMMGRDSGVPEVVKVLSPAEALACHLKTQEGCGSCRACG